MDTILPLFADFLTKESDFETRVQEKTISIQKLMNEHRARQLVRTKQLLLGASFKVQKINEK